MSLIHIATFEEITRSATLAELTQAHGLVGFERHRAESGKPYLQNGNGRKAGLAISHVRKASPPFSIMAVGENAALGIDAEPWSMGSTDEAFLASISAAEDAPLIAKARKTGRDPATLLWVLKEAALKACGEVMTDPRHLTVRPSTNGHIEASTSVAATAPLPRIMLRSWDLSTKSAKRGVCFVAAIAGPRSEGNGPNLDVVCAKGDIQLHEFKW